jgi:hypothetical protein
MRRSHMILFRPARPRPVPRGRGSSEGPFGPPLLLVNSIPFLHRCQSGGIYHYGPAPAARASRRRRCGVRYLGQKQCGPRCPTRRDRRVRLQSGSQTEKQTCQIPPRFVRSAQRGQFRPSIDPLRPGLPFGGPKWRRYGFDAYKRRLADKCLNRRQRFK